VAKYFSSRRVGLPVEWPEGRSGSKQRFSFAQQRRFRQIGSGSRLTMPIVVCDRIGSDVKKREEVLP
jgi:hypothetical protein